MDPNEVRRFRGQVVELTFPDAARVRAHILSVDPDVADNHVFYDLLEILAPGAGNFQLPAKPVGIAVSAQEIVSLTPTDTKRYTKAPGSRLFE